MPGWAWRRRAMSSVTLWPGSWPPSPGLAPWAILISSSSAWARYSAVTPKRALATCLILLFSSEGAPFDRRVDVGVFAALACVRTRAEQIHGVRNGLVRLRRKRAKRHGAGDKGAGNVARLFHMIEGKFRTGGANLKQIAQVGGLRLDGLRCKCSEWRKGQCSSLLGGADDGLQGAHGRAAARRAIRLHRPCGSGRSRSRADRLPAVGRNRLLHRHSRLLTWTQSDQSWRT